MTELHDQAAGPDFWEDAERAKVVMQELNQLKEWVDDWGSADERARDLIELGELMQVESDASMDVRKPPSAVKAPARRSAAASVPATLPVSPHR